MLTFFRLIRWPNLLMIALAQLLIKYALLLPFEVGITFNYRGFLYLLFATISIAAGGYIINDIFDQETDAINKPGKQIIGRKFSEKAAYNWYAALTILGVGLGFYVSNIIGRPGFAIIFVLSAALLYIYASQLKHMAIVGNLVVSFLVGLSILIVGIFELLPAITDSNRETQITFMEIIRDYAIFAFMINLLREMVKDIEDIDGDYNSGSKSLPIVIGRNRTAKVIFVLSIVPVFVITIYVVNYLYTKTAAVIYFLLLIIAPLIYFSVKSFSAETRSDWKHLSIILKLVMLTGILSLLLYPFILL